MRRSVRVGRPLPGANRAHASRDKWTGWILAEAGHGEDWERVFRAGPDDVLAIWAAILGALPRAPVVTVRDRGRHGLVCGVAISITLHARTAVVMTAWHYGPASSVPRLVTAYPIV